MRIKTEKMIPIEKIKTNKKEDYNSIYSMAKRAKEFLSENKWCRSIKRGYVAASFEGIVSICFFEIEPAKKNVDMYLWVITGDLPPAYLVTDNAENAEQALRVYIREMQRWVDAVLAGEPIDEIIPVNTPAKKEYADRLQSRLKSLEKEILPIVLTEGMPLD